MHAWIVRGFIHRLLSSPRLNVARAVKYSVNRSKGKSRPNGDFFMLGGRRRSIAMTIDALNSTFSVGFINRSAVIQLLLHLVVPDDT